MPDEKAASNSNKMGLRRCVDSDFEQRPRKKRVSADWIFNGLNGTLFGPFVGNAQRTGASIDSTRERSLSRLLMRSQSNN
jgi:hypothetical protein